MHQLYKTLAALSVGVFCTMAFHQFPVLGNALLPRTKPIAEAIETVITCADDPESEQLPEDNPPLPELIPQDETAEPAYSLPPELELPQAPPTPEPPAATPVPTATPVPAVTEPIPETTAPISETTDTQTETTAAIDPEPTSEPEAEPIDDGDFFAAQETWFKAYMDYRAITDTSSEQYSLQQNAWTDENGLRRIGTDYLVAMGTGWLEKGCGERFLVTTESGAQFTVQVGDIKADCDTDSTHRYRSCGGGANVLEFIVDTNALSSDARTAGTVSVYPELEGNLTAIARLTE